MTIFIIIWMLCAIPAAVIAHSKKLNVAAWFFLGAVFGVFGIIAVLWQAPRTSVWWAGGNTGGGSYSYGGGCGCGGGGCEDGGDGGGGGGGCGGGGCGGGGCGGGS
jgi:hypothetical protein